MKTAFMLAIGLLATSGDSLEQLPDPGALAAAVPAPLYRDPLYDGAADPVVVWNAPRKTWWMLYTQRRARLDLPGVEWAHGTLIGIAESRDAGMHWTYHGTLKLEMPTSQGSFWAPDCVRDDAGTYHLFVTFVPGAAETHRRWGGTRSIEHYSSADLEQWKREQPIPTASDRCIDPTLCRGTDGTWRLWYKNEPEHSETCVVASRDLRTWEPLPSPEVSKLYGEGPKVFQFKGQYWMLKDPNTGLDVYRSADLDHWTYQGKILERPGWRLDDGCIGKHADVVVCGQRAYIFYMTEPGARAVPFKDGVQPLAGRRSLIQAAELEIVDGQLTCDRNRLTTIELTPPTMP